MEMQESQGDRADVEPMLRDDFSVPLPAGQVLGTASPTGQRRLGVDTEGRLGVDRGALRLACPAIPGWGRHALSYGPVPIAPPAAAAFLFLNGHNGSQTRRVYSGRTRSIARSWATGIVRRALVIGPWRRRAGTLKRWAPQSAHDLTIPWYRTNARIGLFERADRPVLAKLPSFSLKAAGVHNGDLTVRVHGRDLTVVPGVTNVPLSLAVLVCAHGWCYLAGGPAQAAGLTPHPWLRPVAGAGAAPPRHFYVGLHQSVLGEVGFTVDSRLYGLAVGAWGSACPCRFPFSEHVAPRSSVPKADDRAPALLAVPDEPAGLIRAALPAEGATWLRFRRLSTADSWEVRVSSRSIELGKWASGEWKSDRRSPRPRRARELLVQDDGRRILVAVDGKALLGGPVVSSELGGAPGLELGPGWDRRQVVTHPREIRLPEHLVAGSIWQPREPQPSVVDDLRESSGGRLDGRTVHGRRWHRVVGTGNLVLSSMGAHVDASPERPHPGRGLHVVPWDAATVDVSVVIRPPGGGEESKENKCRAGLVVRSDAGDQLIVATYLDRWYVGRSLSSFVTVAGEEHFFRAVWTNVGDRITWGRPFTLRISFDGDRYLARIDGEPVLYRRISDVIAGTPGFRPDFVGLAVNQEFGDDTGSQFYDLRIGEIDGC